MYGMWKKTWKKVEIIEMTVFMIESKHEFEDRSQ